MFLRIAALAACFIVACAAFPARAAERLSLDDAFARVASSHPDLRLFGPRGTVLDAERQSAVLRPATVAGITVENALGSGDASGLSGAEVTLTLASVFERGGKLDVRLVLAQSRIDALAVERESRRLDLLAEVARRYLALIASQRAASIADADIDQRQRTVRAAEKRLRAGASPESTVFTAKAALARAQLDRARSAQRRLAARQHLAALWGEKAPTFENVDGGDLQTLPNVQSFEIRAAHLPITPEQRASLIEAETIAARRRVLMASAKPDISIRLGVRWLELVDDHGLVMSLSIPLGSKSRASYLIVEADAQLDVLAARRDALRFERHQARIENTRSSITPEWKSTPSRIGTRILGAKPCAVAGRYSVTFVSLNFYLGVFYS